VPNYDLLRQYAAQKNIAATSNEELCKAPAIRAMLTERIETLQQDLAHYEKVKHFILLPEPFTIANGELTNTLKVKRRVVYERYAADIARLYEEAERKMHNEQQQHTNEL